MKISLIFSNNRLTQSIDFYVNSIDEIEIQKKYARILNIVSIQFPDTYLIDIKSDSDIEFIEAIITSSKYNL